jgi:agmatine deiminase
MGQAMVKTPKELGYHFPAEWEKHSSTWLSYPHNEVSWPGKIHTIFPYYHRFIKEVSRGELVNINVSDEIMRTSVKNHLQEAGVEMDRIKLHIHPTNDAWCRDHGPAFLVNRKSNRAKVIVNWKYNGWGGKYPAELDTVIPQKIGELLGLQVFYPGIVMEGGAVDFNGAGSLLTTTSCLLHPNRNPGMDQGEIENYLVNFYCVEQVIWLGDGIEGDDTDGHVDDLTRFVGPDTVITMVEPNKSDFNHEPLKANHEQLKKVRLLNGKQLNIVEIQMPKPLYFKDQRLPASYANFYISNAGVMVPTYRCDEDQKAIDLLQQYFPDRPVIGIDSVEIIWGLGSWHCLSQQEPEV